MNRLQIRIKLDSDLCVSDGGAYNSSVDTDVCHDKSGFPYIPAKRIRGCLRECALELQDWGYDIQPEKLFGEAGQFENAGRVRIGNAYPAEFGQVDPSDNPILYHPQNILGYYTYLRSQTSINQETGVADKGSLRTMRVIGKGHEFIAEAEVEESLVEKFKDCCKILHHMGVARTRGLGDVTVTVCELGNALRAKAAQLVPNASRLYYCIRLSENMVCKSVQAGETESQDYIEGSKVLGLIAGRLKKEGSDISSWFSNNELICSNAYFGKNGVRFTEVPGYFYSIKNNKKEYVNQLTYTEGERVEQLNSMKHCYVNHNGVEIFERASVELEERYHHRRPDDKSIGRAKASEGEDADFYQIASIAKGQEFYGFIEGSPEKIKDVYRMLEMDSVAYMGYGSRSEYGKTTISIVKTECVKGNETITTDSILVDVQAPIIMYNDCAMPAVDRMTLLGEIAATLGIDMKSVDMDKTQCYMKYTSVGGYNVTWNLRKPTMDIVDKGTAVKLVLEQKMMIPSGIHFVGERNSEGYGEISVRALDTDGSGRYSFVLDKKNKTGREISIENGTFEEKICLSLIDDFMRYYILKSGLNAFAKEGNRATVSNMLLMCKECKTVAEVSEWCKKRFDKASEAKKKKDTVADDICKKTLDISKCLIEFNNRYHTKWNPESEAFETLKMKYLKTLLIEIKYAIRTPKKGGESDGK